MGVALSHPHRNAAPALSNIISMCATVRMFCGPEAYGKWTRHPVYEPELNRSDTMTLSIEVEPHTVTQRYFRDLHKYKILDPEKARRLAWRFQRHDDREALGRRVKGNLRLVVKIAKGFWRGNHATFADLIQEGNLGLVRAAEKFDPQKKVKFSYYATFWIKAYIQKYLINNHRSVRLGTTQSQRRLFYNLHKTRAKLWRRGIPPTSDAIAEHLDVPEKDVVEMQQRMAAADLSLNAPPASRGPEERMDNLVSASNSSEAELEALQLRSMVRENAGRFRKHLNAREKDILEQRILSERPMTLEKLGNRHGVSRERIRQVERRIVARFRTYLLAQLPDTERRLYE
jgi:RNA polymerase sigma-32 factor